MFIQTVKGNHNKENLNLGGKSTYLAGRTGAA